MRAEVKGDMGSQGSSHKSVLTMIWKEKTDPAKEVCLGYLRKHCLYKMSKTGLEMGNGSISSDASRG